VIKKTVREIETGEGVLIFDDTLQEKPHSKENNLICWHYDHCVNRSVKGINLLNCVGVFIAYYFNGNIIRVRNISY
jgi:hypothetical protein